MHLWGENSHCWHDDSHGKPFGKNGKCRSKQASVGLCSISVSWDAWGHRCFTMVRMWKIMLKTPSFYFHRCLISGKWAPKDCFLKSSPVSNRSWKVLARAGQGSIQQNILSGKVSKGLVIGKYNASPSPWQSPVIVNLSKVHKDLLLFSQLWTFLNLSWSNFHFQHICEALGVYYVSKLCLLLHKAAIPFICPKLIFFKAMVALPTACQSLLSLSWSVLSTLRYSGFTYA